MNPAPQTITMAGEMAEISQHFLAEVVRFEPLLLHYGLVIIMAAVAVEGFGVPAPGQTLLVAGAVLAARGKFDITLLLISAWFATVTGNLIGYYLGRLGGRKLLGRLPVDPVRFERMEHLCKRHGNKLVLVARFIDGVRQLSNLLVGILQMPPALFLLMTSLGAALWVGVWGLGAFLLDRNFHAFAVGFSYLSPYTWAATLLIIVSLGVYLFRRSNKRNAEPPWKEKKPD
jgi:membrane protein DedA with SNARE-associated domain